jgi:hypothetical protein
MQTISNMPISKFNAEGYYDPTAYEALTAVEPPSTYRPLVFICSPFAGDVERNVRKAREYSRFAVRQGAIPIAPHLLFPQFLDDTDEEERANGIFMGLVLMTKCKEVWVFGSNITKGMAIEIKKARQRHIPIRYFNENCEEAEHEDSDR